jgi:metal-dependent amidase/aminoacylase/carboxypeptidase family protein
MKGTIRAVSPEIRSVIVDMMHSKLPLFVESLDGTADISTSIGYDSVINNYEKTKQVEENIIDLFGEEALEIIEKPRLDVEDFSYFLQNVEGCFYRLGTRNVEKDTVYELHHPKFNIDEDSLKIGIELQLKNIMELLKK